MDNVSRGTSFEGKAENENALKFESSFYEPKQHDVWGVSHINHWMENQLVQLPISLIFIIRQRYCRREEESILSFINSS